jgi:hypothetical protein
MAMRTGMIRELDLAKDELTMTIQLPTWYRAYDQKEMAVTKNNKYVVRRNSTGRYVAALNPHIKQWYQALEIDVLMNKTWIVKLLEFEKMETDRKISLYSISIEWFMRNLKIDCHNYTEFLMDGLQAILKINDNKFMPQYRAKMKSDDGTNYTKIQMKPFEGENK